MNTKYNPAIHHRRSIRLKGYNYSRAGAYFVTICTQNRQCLFGHVADGKMVLNDAGLVAKECWYAIPDHFPHVELGMFVVMPNHIHGILFMVDTPVRHNLPPQSKPQGTSKTLGSVVRGFKIGVTKWMRQNTEFYNIWQRNYYDHIIRDENELNRIRQYIANNPAKWDSDRQYPDISSDTKTVRESPPQYGNDPWQI